MTPKKPYLCPEARDLRRRLDAELKANAENAGTTLSFSATEETVIAQIQAAMNRKHDLAADYLAAADEPKLRVKLSTELRLLEGVIERQLRKVSTAAPSEESIRSRRARAAVNARWAREV